MKPPLVLSARLSSLSALIVTGVLLMFFVCREARAQTVDLDSDNDGLLDAWEIRHFGSLNHPDGDAAGNPDGDSCDNAGECNAGTDPYDPSDCFDVVASVFDPAHFEVAWNSILGKRYQISVSTDLANWQVVSDSSGSTPLNFFGTGGVVTVNFSDPANPAITGGATREVWYHDESTGSISRLNTYIAANPEADGVEWRSSLKGPSDYGDRYGDRWRGFIVPKESGAYHFYIASRHQSEFWLDTTDDTADGAGLARESYLFDGTLAEEEDWDFLASQGLADTQKSAEIALVAGQRYYFEVLHNHNGQWDHLAVGWEKDGSGAIEVVPGECLAPAGDFVTSGDYTDNNADTLFAGSREKFVRVSTFGAMSPEALDADGDGVADDVENGLDGFQFFRAQSAAGGQSDGVTLTGAAAADPSADVITVETIDAIARENNGVTGSGIPRIKDVTRFRINRSGSLVPVTVYFTISGAADTMAMGSAGEGDYVVETPTGVPIPSSGGTYAVTLPYGSIGFEIEARAVLDEVVEYPEELTVILQSSPAPGPLALAGIAPSEDYVVGTPSQAAAEIHDARDDSEFNKYYIATFSKDAAAVTATSASGATLLVLNGSNRVAVINDFFENLTSPQVNTHVHKATLKPDGITFNAGPIVESITDDGTETGVPIMGPVSDYTYVLEPRAGFSVQDIVDSLEYDNPKQGNPPGTTPLYNNKHSANNPSGEIWAIYRRQPASELSPDADDRIPPTPTVIPIDPVAEPDKLRRDVARFLTQATFGPTEADIEELVYEIENTHGGDRIAAYDAWIAAQWALPQTLVRDLTHALDMQEYTLRGYFDPARNGAATTPPVAPANWPNFRSQDISNFDSLNIATWTPQRPDANFPLTGTQENQLDGVLGNVGSNNRVRAQWSVMINGRDQLRQRIGFALSEILVISQELTDIRNHHIATARYIDQLAENADDHYREAVEDVTYSPLMGKYLSHLQNSSEASSGVPPDENYAREIMQLFTIGLLEVWDDGFVKLDPVKFNLSPTYTNDEIKGLARVMTGMSWSTNSASNTNWDTPNLDRTNPTSGWYDDGDGNQLYSSRYNYPMAFYNSRHDNGSKTIAGGFVVNNSGTASGRYTSEGDKDLRDVHNYLAGTQTNQLTPKTFAASWSTDPMVNHQSTPAFVSRRLIQRLVTSNPSGPYLYRVAQVWRQTNGQLDEVVRAILLDPEARNLETTELNPEFGKKKEPLLAWVAAIRAIAGRSRVTFDGTVIPGDPVAFPGETYQGGISPTADGNLRNFDYPQGEIDKFLGMVKYDALGRMIPGASPGTFERLPGTMYRFTTLDGGGTSSLLQSPMKAPTVFNWFLPDYQPGGLIADYGLYAPEFQIATESSVFQNVNMFWNSHWGSSGQNGTNMGGTNANSDAAGYSTTRNSTNNHTDADCIVDYWAWINRYMNYPTIPGNGLNDERDRDLQLIDELDDLLMAGRFKLLYPVDASDDGEPVDLADSNLTHYPDRNPREAVLYYLSDTYGTSPPPSNNMWNKVRAALYIMTTSPEFLVQK